MKKLLNLNKKSGLIIILAIIIFTGLVEYSFGRTPICTCGYVKLWEGAVNSSGNSQHLADWYTLSHIIHGFAFYFIIWLVDRKKKLSFWAKLVLAVGLEAGWEILENSPIIINRYRTATLAYNYSGDSIINSLSDVVSMAAGFLFARKSPVWLTLVLTVFFELLALYVIRDNLTLNILMLIYPIEAIKHWQAAL